MASMYVDVDIGNNKSYYYYYEKNSKHEFAANYYTFKSNKNAKYLNIRMKFLLKLSD